ncbi:MAG: DUF4982 domain-containing protein [Alistipes sp.]|nr:DUF4982 domain-containing protein [Alistipes sp.]
MNRSVGLLVAALLSVGASVQASSRIPADARRRLAAGWEFVRQDIGGVWEAMRPVEAGKPESVPLWQPVTLPHCFNAEDAVDPDVNYYQGPGWYRTLLDVANPYADGRTWLEFEGAGQKSDVYVYLTCVGSHTGGYDGWKVDITDAVAAFRRDTAACRRFGGKIPVAVRCDNGRDPETIPSDMSDFNLYGGLYRSVNLVYTPACRFERVRIDAAVDERGKTGTLAVRASVDGAADGARFSLRIAAPDGRVICRAEGPVQEVVEHDFVVKRPALWSPDAPQRYTCSLELVCGCDTLRTSERFGFRCFRFEEHGPFYLNGERLLLRGTHRHEDHAGVGAAMTDELIRREMAQIKAMGVNFIRLGHYQQSELVLDLCDELGLLVWEEIPWCRGGLGGDGYKAQARQMLANMIEQHRNHPAVILWGLGNENDWPGDFADFDKEAIRTFMAELNEQAHRLDPSRATCIRRCDFCKDIVDVYSPSIWAGWYSRRFRDYRAMTEDAVRSVPRFVHAEWGGDSHAGRHSEGPFDGIVAADRTGDWSESYIVRLFDWHLKEQETMPDLTGSLFWTFKDFSTPLRPRNPIPYVNQKGVVQRDGTPKESYYVFQSYWSRTPMVHIYDQPVRWGRPGEAKEVLVYSNCPEVELFVDGRSCGCRKRNPQDFPAAGFHWSGVLREGPNRIEAVARKGGVELRDTVVQEYTAAQWGAPAQLRLTVRNETDDMLLVEAELLDADGRRCLDAADFIRFTSTDPTALVRNQGTACGSTYIQAANGRAAIRVRSGAQTLCAACDRSSVRRAFVHLQQPENHNL